MNWAPLSLFMLFSLAWTLSYPLDSEFWSEFQSKDMHVWSMHVYVYYENLWKYDASMVIFMFS